MSRRAEGVFIMGKDRQANGKAKGKEGIEFEIVRS